MKNTPSEVILLFKLGLFRPQSIVIKHQNMIDMDGWIAKNKKGEENPSKLYYMVDSTRASCVGPCPSNPPKQIE